VSGTYHYLKDGLGSVTGVTTDTGSLVQRYVYSSFGKLLKTVDGSGLEGSPLLKTSYTYTNREFDEETGLYYYRARYYDSHSGRFMQEDPHPGRTFDPQSFLNKYNYTRNNPLFWIDPTGEVVSIGVAVLTGIIVGAFVGGIVALINGDNVLEGMFRGALVGGSLALLVATGGGSVAGLIGGTSFIKALTSKGSFTENFFNNLEAGTIKGLVGGEAQGQSKNYFKLGDWFDRVASFVGAAFTIKDLNDNNCSDNATNFARKHLCAAWRL